MECFVTYPYSCFLFSCTWLNTSMYKSMHKQNLTNTWLHTSMHNLVYIVAFICASAHVWGRPHPFIHSSTWSHTFMHMLMYTCTPSCTCVHAHTHVYVSAPICFNLKSMIILGVAEWPTELSSSALVKWLGKNKSRAHFYSSTLILIQGHSPSPSTMYVCS